MFKYRIGNIKWETDGEEVDFPTEVVHDSEIAMGEDEISDWLSDTYGFLHNGFDYTEEEDLPRTKPLIEKVLEIPSKELAEYEELLTKEGVDYDEEKIAELSTVKMWTTHFADGCFADLKVNSNCRSDGDFYAEMVLFDKDGNQLDYSEPQYDLEGTWNLSSRDKDYTIDVKPI